MEAWSTLGSDHLIPYKEIQYSLNKRLCVLQRRSGDLDKKEISFLCLQPIVGLSNSWSRLYKAYIVAKLPANTLLTTL